MSQKIKTWLIWGLVIALFILGTPFVEMVFAETAPAKSCDMIESPDGCKADEAATSRIKVGDNYLSFITAQDGSICVHLLDSELRPVAANEKEASLAFSLPDGSEVAIGIAAHSDDECAAKKECAGGCCQAQEASTSASASASTPAGCGKR